VKSYQPPDFMEQYGQVLSLRNLQERGKMSAIQLRQAQAEEQQRQRDLRDQQGIEASYVKAEGDPDKFEAFARESGVSPNGLLKVRGLVLDQKTKMETLDEKQRANARQQAELRAGYMAPLSAAPPEQRPALWGVTRSQVIAAGHAKEDQIPVDYPGDQVFEIEYAGALGTKNYLEQLDKRAQEQRNQAEETRKAAEEGRKAEEYGVKLPGTRADATGKVRQDAAARLAAAGSAEAYRTIWEQLPAGVARDFDPPETWDAKKTPERSRQFGMTPTEQATSLRGNRPEVLRTPEGTYLTDVGTGESIEAKTPAGGPIKAITGVPRTAEGFTPGEAARRLDQGMAEADRAQVEEQEQHQLRIRAGNVIKLIRDAQKAGKPTYTAADGREYPATNEQAKLLQTEFDAATQRVTALQRKQRDLRQKFKVGEFSEQPSARVPLSQTGTPPPVAAPPPAAPGRGGVPAQTPPAPGRGTPAPAAPARPGKIHVRLKDGRPGWIIPAEFDDKTMTKL
jgi:hypothetical protein